MLARWLPLLAVLLLQHTGKRSKIILPQHICKVFTERQSSSPSFPARGIRHGVLAFLGHTFAPFIGSAVTEAVDLFELCEDAVHVILVECLL